MRVCEHAQIIRHSLVLFIEVCYVFRLVKLLNQKRNRIIFKL